MKLHYVLLSIIATALSVIAVAESSRAARAAGVIHAATVSGSSCTSGTELGTNQTEFECFVSWSDGTRCVSVVGAGVGAPSSLQCAFSGVVGVP